MEPWPKKTGDLATSSTLRELNASSNELNPAHTSVATRRCSRIKKACSRGGPSLARRARVNDGRFAREREGSAAHPQPPPQKRKDSRFSFCCRVVAALRSDRRAVTVTRCRTSSMYFWNQTPSSCVSVGSADLSGAEWGAGGTSRCARTLFRTRDVLSAGGTYGARGRYHRGLHLRSTRAPSPLCSSWRLSRRVDRSIACR